MEKKAVWSTHHNAQMLRLDNVMEGTTASNLEHTVQDLHDILNSYYKVARKRFVDNICMQGASHYLVTGPDAPVRVFSPGFIADLTPEQLEFIAGEDVVTKRRRAELNNDIHNLEEGKKVLI